MYKMYINKMSILSTYIKISFKVIYESFVAPGITDKFVSDNYR